MEIYDALKRHSPSDGFSLLIEGQRLLVQDYSEEDGLLRITDAEGEIWYLHPERISAFSLGKELRTAKADKNPLTPDQTEYITTDQVSTDVIFLSSVVPHVTVPDYINQDIIWSDLNESFYKSPLCLRSVKEIWNEITDPVFLTETHREYTLLQIIRNLEQTNPEKKNSFAYLQGYIALLKHRYHDAANLLLQAGQIEQALCVMDKIHNKKLLMQCMGTYMLENVYESNGRDQRITLRYAALCDDPKEVSIFIILQRMGEWGLSPAKKGAIIALIQKKDPDFAYDPNLRDGDLIQLLSQNWGISEPISPSYFLSVKDFRFQETDKELPTRSGDVSIPNQGVSQDSVPSNTQIPKLFTAKMKKRITSNRSNDMVFSYFWVNKSPTPDSRDLYVKPVQIIDPVLGKYLQLIDDHNALLKDLTWMNLIFAIGENKEDYTGVYVFLPSPIRAKIITDIQSHIEKWNASPFFVKYQGLQPLKIDNWNNFYDERIANVPTEWNAEDDFEIFMFLRKYICSDVRYFQIPSSWQEDHDLCDAATRMINATSEELPYVFSRFLYVLDAKHREYDLELCKYFLFGLPNGNPYHLDLLFQKDATQEMIYSKIFSSTLPYFAFSYILQWKEAYLNLKRSTAHGKANWEEEAKDSRRWRAIDALADYLDKALNENDAAQERMILDEQLTDNEKERLRSIMIY